MREHGREVLKDMSGYRAAKCGEELSRKLNDATRLLKAPDVTRRTSGTVMQQLCIHATKVSFFYYYDYT